MSKNPKKIVVPKPKKRGVAPPSTRAIPESTKSDERNEERMAIDEGMQEWEDLKKEDSSVSTDSHNMKSETTIYHNPRCSTSRKTLQLLRENDVEPKIIEYLKTPPTAEELTSIIEALGIKASDIIRKKEGLYKELKLDRANVTDAELTKAMAEHPILIERPIVTKKGRAALGRPPENVLEIL